MHVCKNKAVPLYAMEALGGRKPPTSTSTFHLTIYEYLPSLFKRAFSKRFPQSFV
jgi:hypothetical protein